MQLLHCALGAMDIGAGLVTEEQARLFGARVDGRHRVATVAVASVVGEGEGPSEGTRHWRRVDAEHRVQQSVASDQ